MYWPKKIAATVVVCIFIGGCSKSPETKEAQPEAVANVVTADIQAGIEHHIEEQIRLGDGYFKLPFGDKELRLKLVRVHTEYLANLGPRSHFACVDLASTDGNVYDVDFFLKGDPNAMTVTETTERRRRGWIGSGTCADSATW